VRILVKVGGAPLLEPASRAAFAEAVAAARRAGHELLVVHGGGEQVRAWSKRLGIQDRYVNGLRVTDAQTAEVVLAVLGGEVNRQVVAALGAAGAPAVGLTGADGNAYDARRLTSEGADLGYVGEVAGVRPGLALGLLAQGFVPVMASLAPLAEDAVGSRDRLYNINADHAAAPLAAAFAVDALLFLTDVPGVLDAAGELVARLTPGLRAELAAAGVFAGGMRPKVDAAVSGARACPRAVVKIAPAGGAGCVLEALLPEVGTHVIALESSDG
jgi:acetylglutamate kinase